MTQAFAHRAKHSMRRFSNSRIGRNRRCDRRHARRVRRRWLAKRLQLGFAEFVGRPCGGIDSERHAAGSIPKSYDLTDIGSGLPGSPGLVPAGLNDKGTVVGSASVGVIPELSELQPVNVRSAGRLDFSKRHAYRTSPARLRLCYRRR